MTSHERDMLVAAPDRWDEACFAVPAVRALIASGLTTGVVCREAQESFWKTVPGLEVLALSHPSKPKTLTPRIHPDWKAVLLWEPGWIADTIKPTGIKKKLGPGAKKLSRILTHTLNCATTHLDHRVRFYLSAIEELGVHTASPEFFSPVSIGLDPLENSVILCPDSDFGPSHEWKQDDWYLIGKSLQDRGVRVMIIGLDGGRGMGKRLAGALGDRAEFFQASPLQEAIPMLATHGLCVSADGSLPHLASHFGATCITLFGPNDPAWKRPLGKRHTAIRRHVECAPCLLPKCPFDSRCQNELTPERVCFAVNHKLA